MFNWDRRSCMLYSGWIGDLVTSQLLSIPCCTLEETPESLTHLRDYCPTHHGDSGTATVLAVLQDPHTAAHHMWVMTHSSSINIRIASKICRLHAPLHRPASQHGEVNKKYAGSHQHACTPVHSLVCPATPCSVTPTCLTDADKHVHTSIATIPITVALLHGNVG